MDIKTKTKMPKMVSISLEDLRSCPKLILSRSHWYPVHKVEKCGANEIKIIKVEEPKVKPIKLIKKRKMYQEIKKICVQCKEEFVWTEGEQRFMNRLFEEGKIQKVVEPKRCPDCRKEKRKRFENRPPQESY